MKLLPLIMLFGLLITGGALHRESGLLFQVVSSHPHELNEISSYTKTVHRDGRLWVVELNPEAPSNILKHLRPLSGHERSYLYEGEWIQNVSFSRKSTIKKLISHVDKKAIKKDVELLSAYRTRLSGSAENRLALIGVRARFQSMGYIIRDFCYQEGDCSFTADKNGSTSSTSVLMVMGHIDSVGEDFAGADDNGSGIAVLLEMARILKDHPNKNTIRFFVSNGEEEGFLGSTHYVKLLASENKLNELALVINMDMVGYNSDGIVDLETDPEFEELAQWYGNLASGYTKLKTRITLGAWGSDHVPFLQHRVPAIMTMENWETKSPCYHKACDLPDTLNYDYAAEIAKLNTSAILIKDHEL